MNVNEEIIKEFNNTFPGIPTKHIVIFVNHINCINIDPDYWDIWFKLQKHDNNNSLNLNEHVELFINWYLSTNKSSNKSKYTHKKLKKVFHKTC